jgi:hypothetical protein
LERLRRASAAAREGERIEKVALEARCHRAAELLEAEIMLRRQAEAKALRCDKAEESSARIATEVCMLVCRCVCV